MDERATIGGVAARVSSPRLIGRRRELDALIDAVRGLGASDRRVVLIGGEAGIGKSRLIAELPGALRSAGEDAQLIRGTCVELTDGTIPFGPVLELLEELAATADEAALAAPAGRLRDELAGSVDGETSSTPGSGGMRRLVRVHDLLAAVAGIRTLVVAIDDLHWADRSTLDLLLFLARRIRRQRILLVLAYRTEELHRRHPVRPVLAQLDRIAIGHLVLDPLDASELREQVAAIVGDGVEASLVDRVVARADGNPFHVEEMLAAGASAPLPSTLRDLLLTRVEALPAAGRAVVRGASVIGRPAGERLLMTVAGLDEAAVREGLRAAVERGILLRASDDRYTVRHALLREAVHDELLSSERVELHRRAASSLADDGDRSRASLAAERAYHLDSGRLPAEALHAYVAAGAAADAASAWAEATRAYERALELLADPATGPADRPETVDLLARTARTALLAGDGERACRLQLEAISRAAADPSIGPARLAELHAEASYYLNEVGRHEESVHHAEVQAAMTPSADRRARAASLEALGSARMLAGRYREAIELTTEAIELADAGGWLEIVGPAAATRAICFADLGWRSRAMADIRRARDIAREVGDEADLGTILVNVMSALVYLGEFDETAVVGDEAIELGARLGTELGWDPWTAAFAGQARFWAGQWSAVDELVTRGMAGYVPEGSLPHRYLEHTRRLLAAARGDEPHSGPWLDPTMLRSGTPDSIADVWYASAFADVWRDEPEAALPKVDAGLRSLDGSGSHVERSMLIALGVRAAADVAVRRRARRAGVGDVVEQAEGWASTLEDLATELDRDEGRRSVWVSLARPFVRAELARARAEDDPGAWRAAASAASAMAVPLHAAYARFREAEASVAGGDDRDGAVEALADAHALATALGAAPLERHIGDLDRRARLGAIDRSPDPGIAAPPPVDPWRLSTREREVLDLVAHGLTNREIATRLFISDKTASVHVTHILDKMGVSSRTEAALLAARAGLAGSPPDAPESA